MGARAALQWLHIQAYRIPTDFPEADGTISWNSTTIVVVHAEAGGQRGWDLKAVLLSQSLALLGCFRERAPPKMESAAGEYGYTLGYFRRMFRTGAVDVQQAEATRCGGVTGFLQSAALSLTFERFAVGAECVG